VHPPAAESGDLTSRVQTGNRSAGGVQDATGEVGLQATQGLAGEDVEPYRDQRAGGSRILWIAAVRLSESPV
jgi:hypothetical protein